MVTARTYGQHCGIAYALDLVGERWALLVVRELILGPKRFTDLRNGLPGVATNVLSQRLKELERNGIVGRRVLPPPAASTVYELTAYGRELEPIVLRLGAWAAQTMERAPGQPMRSEWLMVAVKARFRPAAAKGIRATVGLRFPDGDFTIHLAGGSLQVSPGWTADADLAPLRSAANRSTVWHHRAVRAKAECTERKWVPIAATQVPFSAGKAG